MSESEDGLKARYAENYQYYYDKGNALFELGRYEDAAVNYRKATEINPSFAWAFCNLAGALTEAGRYEEALAAIEKAIAIDPKDKDFLKNKQDILKYMDEAKQSRGSPEELTVALFEALHNFDGRRAIQLVQQGADIGSRDNLGNTPLHYFYQCRSLQTCKDFAHTLVEHGANLHAENHVGDTPVVKLQGIKNARHKEELTNFLIGLGAILDRDKVAIKRARIGAMRESLTGGGRSAELRALSKKAAAALLALVLIIILFLLFFRGR